MNNYDYEDVDRLDRLAERDDSERRGDSLLDEENFNRRPDPWPMIRSIADMTMEGEFIDEDEDEEFIIENDDAWSTVMSLIDDARTLMNALVDHEKWTQDVPDRIVMVQTSDGPFMAIDVPNRRYTVDEARNLANAILSELEIAQREGTGDW